MKFWYLTAVLALVCAAYLVRDLVRNPGGGLGPDGFGGLVGLLVMGVLTVVLFRWSARGARLDDTGPVVPSEDPAVAAGTRWTVEQIAAVLALYVEPMNGLVFADGRTKTIRVMVDPPSAITWHPGGERQYATDAQRERVRRGGGSGVSSPYFEGRWTRIRLRPGQLPEVTNRQSTMQVGYNDAGVFVPLWSPSATGALQADPIVLSTAGARRPVSFEFDTRDLLRVVDSTAVRAGWVRAAQVAARPSEPDTRHEVRSVERTQTRTESTQTTVDPDRSRSETTHTTSETTHPPAEPTQPPAEPTPATSEASPTTSRSSQTTSATSRPDEQPAADEIRAKLEAARQEHTRVHRQSGLAVSKIMTLIGAVVLAGCVIGTVLGLVFGMPWWASFIIIGSGLFFCLVFVLPLWFIAGKPWGSRTT